MTSATTEFTATGVGQLLPANDGGTVSAVVPAGCVLRRSSDRQSWETVETLSPFEHVGAFAHYRIDCVSYDGTPKTATLTITGGGA